MPAPSCGNCRLVGDLPTSVVFNEAIARDMVKAGVCHVLRGHAHCCWTLAGRHATRALATALERIARIPPPPGPED